MEIIMEEQIKLDNQVAQCAPFLEQGQVGQIGQVETQSAVLVPKLNITNLSKVDSEPIEWLWPKVLPKGCFVLLGGPPEQGKSTVTLDIAARITTGSEWPACNQKAEEGFVTIINTEDDQVRTIKPRLEAAGAKTENIQVIDGLKDYQSFDISRHKELLIREVFESEKKPSLLIIDPLSEFLGSFSSHNNTETHKAMAEVVRLANEYSVCILGIMHLNKTNYKTAIDKLNGSVGFGAKARVVYFILKDPEDDENRLMLPVKNNLAPKSPGFSFRIRDNPDSKMGVGNVCWSSEYETRSADSLFQENLHISSRNHELDSAYREFLSSGRKKSKEVSNYLGELGYTEKQIRSSGDRLGVVKYKDGPIFYHELPSPNI